MKFEPEISGRVVVFHGGDIFFKWLMFLFFCVRVQVFSRGNFFQVGVRLCSGD